MVLFTQLRTRNSAQKMSLAQKDATRSYATSLCWETLDKLLGKLKNLLSSNGKLFIHTVHPFTACGDEPYIDGWRTETFKSFGSAYKEVMPWYFRTASSWLNLIESTGLRVCDCKEPIHPSTGKPLSLLMTCHANMPRG